jgi:hypothetical protein
MIHFYLFSLAVFPALTLIILLGGGAGFDTIKRLVDIGKGPASHM